MAGLTALVLFSPSSFARAPFLSYCSKLISSVFSTESPRPAPENFNSYIVSLARDPKARAQGFPTLLTEFHRDTLEDLVKHTKKYANDSSKNQDYRRFAEDLKNKLIELSSHPTLDRIEFLATAKLFSILFTDFDPSASPASNLNKAPIDIQKNGQLSGTWTLWFYQKIQKGNSFHSILDQMRNLTQNNQVPGQLRFPNHKMNEIEDFEVFWDEDVAPILTSPGTEMVDGSLMSPIAKAIHDEVHGHKARNTDSRRLAAKSGERIRQLIKNTTDPQLKLGLRLMYWIFAHELNIPVLKILELGRSPSVHLEEGPIHGQHIIESAKEALREGVFGAGYSHHEISRIANRGYEAFVTAYLNLELQP